MPKTRTSPSRTPKRRMTAQRKFTLAAVQASDTHPSADEVLRVVRKQLPSISLGTVYRNLRLLVSEGAIREVQFLDSPSRFDGMLEDHEHFYCTACGKVLDLRKVLDLTTIASKIEGSASFYKLDIYGLCGRCTSDKSSKGKR